MGYKIWKNDTGYIIYRNYDDKKQTTFTINFFISVLKKLEISINDKIIGQKQKRINDQKIERIKNHIPK